MSLVLLVTWALAAAVVALYVSFVVWRVRADRRKKDAAREPARPTSSDGPSVPTVDQAKLDATIAAAARIAGTTDPPRPADTPGPAGVPPSESGLTAAIHMGGGGSGGAATVAEALAGIKMPHELAPITMVAERPGVRDRVVFSTTTAPAEAVGTALGDELERLGYEVKPIDTQTVAATRGDQRLVLVIHPDGALATIGNEKAFAAAPDHSVVVEIWIP